MGKAGKREYVQVLRLVETFDLEVLHGAVKDALRLGAIGYRRRQTPCAEAVSSDAFSANSTWISIPTCLGPSGDHGRRQLYEPVEARHDRCRKCCWPITSRP